MTKSPLRRTLMLIIDAVIIATLLWLIVETAYAETPTPTVTATPTATPTPVPTGWIVIQVDTDPETDNPQFDVTTNGAGLSNFDLRDDDEKRFDGLVAGRYRFTLKEKAGWEITFAHCTVGPNTRVDLSEKYEGRLVVQLGAGESAKCGFTLAPVPPTLTVTPPEPTGTPIIVTRTESVFVPFIVPVAPTQALAPVVAQPPVSVSPPRTGDAGLLP